MTAIGRSGLETPSYMFMSVFAFFVALSIIIHKVLHRIHDCLSNQKRIGLKTAFKTMINEVMLLGFISLLLTLIEESVSKICSTLFRRFACLWCVPVDEKYYKSHWIPMDYVSDCDSCLHNTRRLSEEFRLKTHCHVHEDGATGHDAPHEQHQVAHHGEEHEASHEEPEHHMNAQRRLLSGDHGHGSPCHDGEVQLISAKALHEVHTLIFLLAVFHVVIVVMMVMIATYRLRRWKRWKKEDDARALMLDKRTWTIQVGDKEHEPPASAKVNQQTPFLARVIQSKSEVEVDPEAQVQNSNPQPFAFKPQEKFEREGIETNTVRDGSNGAWSRLSAARTTIAQNGASTSGGQNNADSREEHTASIASLILNLNQFKQAAQVKDSESDHAKCNEPPDIDISAASQEWKTAFWKQWWSPITKDEFRILRHAFLTEHKTSEKFDFEEYLLMALDDDISKVVEIPNAGWAAVIVGYTFWAPARFSSFPVLAALILIEIAVIVVCTKLVTIVRLLAANDQVHKLKPDAFWFKNPKHILPLIRIALFVDSVIFPLFLEVAWQYGFQSCALVGSIADDAWIHKAAVPLIVFINVFCFVHVSWILMPLYSVTVHMSSTTFSQHLLEKGVRIKVISWLDRVRNANGNERQHHRHEEGHFDLLASGSH